MVLGLKINSNMFMSASFHKSKLKCRPDESDKGSRGDQNRSASMSTKTVLVRINQGFNIRMLK